MSGEKIFYLTKEGLEKTKKQYADLKKLRLVKTQGDIPRIWQSEDVNPEYLSFQEDLNFLEAKLHELEHIIKNAELIAAPPKEKQNTVWLGATVTLEDTDKHINEFKIVGTLEANPGEGKLSSESPVGKAILGKKIGEEVLITSPIKVVYKIKQIKYQLS